MYCITLSLDGGPCSIGLGVFPPSARRFMIYIEPPRSTVARSGWIAPLAEPCAPMVVGRCAVVSARGARANPVRRADARRFRVQPASWLSDSLG